jgi:hypothetical protein
MGILNHPDAQWGSRDFDLPLLPVHQPLPQFLQPAHVPQMRLPPMCTPWEPSNRALPAFGAAPVSDLGNYYSFEQSYGDGASFADSEKNHSSGYGHAMIPSLRDMIPAELLSSASESTPTLPSRPTIERDDAGIDPSHLESDRTSQTYQPVQPSDNVRYDTAWDREESSQLCEYEKSLNHTQVVPSAEDVESQQFEIHSPLPHPVSATAISPVQSSTALPLASPSETYVIPNLDSKTSDQLMVDMAPPPRKRSRKGSVLQPRVKEQHVRGGSSQDIGHNHDLAALESRSKAFRAEETPSRRASERAGPFVHNLCGKSFATRQKVKKHHWGNRMNNLNTTTGCWFKYDKPSASWDDHPSCKEVQKSTPLKSQKLSSRTTEAKAPMVPGMVPKNWNNYSQDLPKITTKPVNAPHTPSQYVQPSFTQDGSFFYHNHNLAPSSPFESLLAVVNVAAADVEMEAPIPKGRSDSVLLSNLDSQAIAAERTGRYQPAYAYNSGGQDDEHYRHEAYMSSSDHNRFDLRESLEARSVPMDSAYSSCSGAGGYTLSTGSSTSGFTHSVKEDVPNRDWYIDPLNTQTWAAGLPPPMMGERRYRP